MSTLASAVLENMVDADPTNGPCVPILVAIHAACSEIEKEYGHNDAIEKVLSKIFINLHAKRIPEAYCMDWKNLQAKYAEHDAYHGPTVPLHDILYEFGNAIINVTNPIQYDAKRSGVLYPLRNQLALNEQMYTATKDGKLIASEIDAPKEEMIRGFLSKTPFARFFNTQVPFQIPRKTWASHGIILAPPNHGKTQLLGCLLSSFLSDRSQPVGLFVLDPHGDLFNTLRHRVEPERLVLLDPDTSPPALNFLDFGTSTEAQTLQTFSYLMSSLSGGLSDKQGAIVPYLLKLLRRIPEASLETLRLIVDEKVKRPEQSQFASTIGTLPLVDQGFFHNQFYNARMQETKDAIGWKLYSALSSDTFRQMFAPAHYGQSEAAHSGSVLSEHTDTQEKNHEPRLEASHTQHLSGYRRPTSYFDADAAMRERKVVLVKGSRAALGDEGMQVFLQFIVAQFFAAALRRDNIEPSKRALCLLFADEAHHIFNSQTANILTECRKYGLGFVAATQVVQQIPGDVKAAVYGATAIKIAGPVSHSDANILAREMFSTPDFIRSMGSTEGSHAEWAIHVAPSKKAMKVRVPYGALEQLRTHEGPTYQVAEPSRAKSFIPAEADTRRIPQPLTITEDDQDYFDACYEAAMTEDEEIPDDPSSATRREY